MKFEQEDINKVARLARLELNQSEEQKYGHDLNEILDYVDVLSSQNLVDSHKVANLSGNQTVLREDKITASLNIKDVLRNAPDRNGNYIKVKNVF